MIQRKRIFVALSIVFTLIFSETAFNKYAEGFTPLTVEKIIGQKAPSLSLKDLTGRNISISEYK